MYACPYIYTPQTTYTYMSVISYLYIVCFYYQVLHFEFIIFLLFMKGLEELEAYIFYLVGKITE